MPIKYQQQSAAKKHKSRLTSVDDPALEHLEAGKAALLGAQQQVVADRDLLPALQARPVRGRAAALALLPPSWSVRGGARDGVRGTAVCVRGLPSLSRPRSNNNNNTFNHLDSSAAIPGRAHHSAQQRAPAGTRAPADAARSAFEVFSYAFAAQERPIDCLTQAE